MGRTNCFSSGKASKAGKIKSAAQTAALVAEGELHDADMSTRQDLVRRSCIGPLPHMSFALDSIDVRSLHNGGSVASHHRPRPRRCSRPASWIG